VRGLAGRRSRHSRDGELALAEIDRLAETVTAGRLIEFDRSGLECDDLREGGRFRAPGAEPGVLIRKGFDQIVIAPASRPSTRCDRIAGCEHEDRHWEPACGGSGYVEADLSGSRRPG